MRGRQVCVNKLLAARSFFFFLFIALYPLIMRRAEFLTVFSHNTSKSSLWLQRNRQRCGSFESLNLQSAAPFTAIRNILILLNILIQLIVSTQHYLTILKSRQIYKSSIHSSWIFKEWIFKSSSPDGGHIDLF